MSGIPRVGLQIVSLLGGLTVISLGLKTMANGKMNANTPPNLPEKIGKRTSLPDTAPNLDSERDSPKSTYRIYLQGEKEAIYVSVSCASTLNIFRTPFEYLFDSDGRPRVNQKVLIPRKGEKAPMHMLAVGFGRSESLMLLHWIQSPGSDPIPETLDASSAIFGAIALHQPVYVCDVWVPVRIASDYGELQDAIIEIADKIDRQIKSKK